MKLRNGYYKSRASEREIKRVELPPQNVVAIIQSLIQQLVQLTLQKLFLRPLFEWRIIFLASVWLETFLSGQPGECQSRQESPNPDMQFFAR